MLAFARSARKVAAVRQTARNAFLHGVLGEPVVAKDAEGEAVRDPADPVVELAERALVAACHQRDECLVGEVRVHAQRQVILAHPGRERKRVDEHVACSHVAGRRFAGSEPVSRRRANKAAIQPTTNGRSTTMRKSIAVAALAAVATSAALGAAIALGPGDGTASSHREAPLIADDPSADLTDVYAFRSPDRPSTVTILANVIPGEDPAAGPNWYTFSPGARYNLKLDTTGDVRPDVIYRFEFQRKTGPFFLGDTAQPYTVTRIAKGKTTVVAHGTTPPNNIGKRSTPDYRSLVTKSIVAFDDGAARAFAGQRDDPFFGDIGAIFDLVAIRKGTGNMGGGKDFFAGYGVHTFGVQVPIAGLAAKNGTIGVWASVDRRKVTTRGATTRDAGAWVQVNRLGNPLVNEVIIPTGMKDRWNALQPWSESQFKQYYENPILAAVINKLYKLGAPETGRDDLVAVLLTGVPKLNFTGPKLADVLRLNLTVPVAKSPNRLGVLGGDTQGWPNGRRLSDDVIDIAEQAVGGFLKDVKLPLGDGVNADDVDTLDAFPYVADPKSGFDNTKGLQK